MADQAQPLERAATPAVEGCRKVADVGIQQAPVDLGDQGRQEQLPARCLRYGPRGRHDRGEAIGEHVHVIGARGPQAADGDPAGVDGAVPRVDPVSVLFEALALDRAHRLAAENPRHAWQARAGGARPALDAQRRARKRRDDRSRGRPAAQPVDDGPRALDVGHLRRRQDDAAKARAATSPRNHSRHWERALELCGRWQNQAAGGLPARAKEIRWALPAAEAAG